jgi:5-deoxy-glucuronate isomerase
VALPSAEASRKLPPAHVQAKDIQVETRGAGSATRQVNNLFIAGGAPGHRLVVVEVLTPGGNWSSYPPHKHDDASNAGEAELEEIYYFRIQGRGGFGMHRTYTSDRVIDQTVAVHDGDLFLVPRGYHGPCVAPPEFPMYYLNVLAGASDARSLGFSDDPAYAWIRESWKRVPRDPRVPLVSPVGAAGCVPGPRGLSASRGRKRWCCSWRPNTSSATGGSGRCRTHHRSGTGSCREST